MPGCSNDSRRYNQAVPSSNGTPGYPPTQSLFKTDETRAQVDDVAVTVMLIHHCFNHETVRIRPTIRTGTNSSKLIKWAGHTCTFV